MFLYSLSKVNGAILSESQQSSATLAAVRVFQTCCVWRQVQEASSTLSCLARSF